MPKKRYYESKIGGAKSKKQDGGEKKFLGDRVKSMKKEFYAGFDVRKRQELEDSYMLREDQSQIANLPQQPIMRLYPTTDEIATPYLDDTARGVDKQLNADVKESKRKQHPEKY